MIWQYPEGQQYFHNTRMAQIQSLECENTGVAKKSHVGGTS